MTAAPGSTPASLGAPGSFDFDVIVIGAGYGGFDAAKHAAEHGLKVAIVESRDMGGTCVNRGCVPSKALLAASGRVRELADAEHLAGFGIHAAPVRFERQKIADHAAQLVATIRSNLTKTLERVLQREGDLPHLLQVALEPRRLVRARLSYDERQRAKDAGFRWNEPVRGAWSRRLSEREIAALPFPVDPVAADGPPASAGESPWRRSA